MTQEEPCLLKERIEWEETDPVHLDVDQDRLSGKIPALPGKRVSQELGTKTERNEHRNRGTVPKRNC